MKPNQAEIVNCWLGCDVLGNLDGVGEGISSCRKAVAELEKANRGY